MTDMHGRTALVTGAGNGLGRVLAQQFADCGAAVVIADIDADAGEATANAIRENGGKALSIHADVALEETSRELVAAALSTYGRLDFAINNAAIEGEVLPLAEQTAEQFNRVIAIDLAGVFFGLKHQLPAIVNSGGGAIVNVASIAGLRGHPGLAPYVAAKHGVVGLTRVAAIEYGAQGVRVNALCPGGIRTPQLERYLDAAPALRASLIDGNPLRRFGEPEEMAKAAFWLCSDAASYINGHALVVDGGKIISDA